MSEQVQLIIFIVLGVCIVVVFILDIFDPFRG